jgi:Na+/H+ antiporter NhaD/arsenite permease-like protein
VITGGIHLSGDIKAKPWVNTTFLGLGWVLASIMGTTGAAMLLIRPLLTTNQQREHRVHTVLFFIAICANCGGLLTPLGDPPLFMLFLRGAEFTWFASMWLPWLFTGGLLLAIYFALDTYYYNKEHWTALSADYREHVPLRLGGSWNFLYLVGVVLTVAFVNAGSIPEMGAEDAPLWLKYLREIVLLSLTGLSLYTTKKKVRYELNKFTWGPIIEVAVLFLGIFTTMTPALAYLNANAASLGLSETWQFYYSTGLLSSFLDNTPTAVAFHSVATGLAPDQMAAFGSSMVAGIPEILLTAICIGSVFFGAMTYIGNGPNFMVKAIAEENGIKMPSFFGYMCKFSLIVLLPIYILVQLIFL